MHTSMLCSCSLLILSGYVSRHCLRDSVQVPLDNLRDNFLCMVAGSVCKDWSTMGKGEGFTGKWVILAGIMLALCRRLQPLILFHECTLRFPHKVFDALLGKTHQDFHSAIAPTDFGAPVRRGRSYDAVAA